MPKRRECYGNPVRNEARQTSVYLFDWALGRDVDSKAAERLATGNAASKCF